MPCFIQQDVIVYEEVGYLSAPSYFSVDQDGRIIVRETLLNDFALTYVVCKFWKLLQNICLIIMYWKQMGWYVNYIILCIVTIL